MMRAMVRCLLALALCSAAAVTLGGCNKSTAIKLAPTSGVVLMDGKPLEGVSVVLQQEGLPMVASGKTDKDGRFKMSTYASLDGAPIGDCIATVTAIGVDISALQKEVPVPDNSSIKDVEERARANRAAFGARREKLTQMQRDRDKDKQQVVVPAKYNDAKTSNLKFKIQPSKNNEIKIELTK